MPPVFSQVCSGDVIVAVIAAANVPQRLTDVQTLVKWLQCNPSSKAGEVNGIVVMSYGKNVCVLPSLSLGTQPTDGPGKYFDLNNVWIESDTPGDKVVCNFGPSY
jgi:hypothetical protein